MQKRRVRIRLLITGAMLALLGFFLRSEREVTWCKKPTSYWFEQSTFGRGGSVSMADMAFHELGTNALPFLIEELNRGESFSMKYDLAWADLPYSLRAFLPIPHPIDRPVRALNLLSRLGPPAVAAVPDIVALANREERKLVNIDRQSEHLEFSNHSAFVFAMAIDTLANIGGADPEIIPTILRAHSYEGIRTFHSYALDNPNLQAAAKAALPFLKARLRSSNPAEREMAKMAIRNLMDSDPEAVPLPVRMQFGN